MLKENKDLVFMVLGILASMIVLLVILSFIAPGTLNFGNLGTTFGNLFGVNSGKYVYTTPPAMTIDTSKDYQATIKTNMGEIKINLYTNEAPQTVSNFVFLSNEGYYSGVLFHRVVKDFVIQGGDRNTLDSDKTNDGKGGPGYTFNDEINWDSLGFTAEKRQELVNVGYSSNSAVESKHLEQKSIAMANSGPNTNGSQFFIVTAPSNDPQIIRLDGRHTVFGKVIDGWDIVLAINNVAVDEPNSASPRPLQDVIINSIEITTL